MPTADVLDQRVRVDRQPVAVGDELCTRGGRPRPGRANAPAAARPPSTMFSATVMTGISMKCWCTMPMPAPIASAARRSRPAAVDDDLALVRGGTARRGCSSASTCRRRSRRAARGPRPRCRSNRRRRWRRRRGYRLVMPRSSSTVSPGAPGAGGDVGRRRRAVTTGSVGDRYWSGSVISPSMICCLASISSRSPAALGLNVPSATPSFGEVEGVVRRRRRSVPSCDRLDRVEHRGVRRASRRSSGCAGRGRTGRRSTPMPQTPLSSAADEGAEAAAAGHLEDDLRALARSGRARAPCTWPAATKSCE